MDKFMQEKLTRRKFLTSLLGLLILTILMIIKPAVNNKITEIYFWISYVGVCLIILLVNLKNYYFSEKLSKIVFSLSDFFSLFVVACCLFQFIFVFGYFKADVDGVSMYPTLKDENILIVRSTDKVDNFDIVIVQYDEELNIKIPGIFNHELLVKKIDCKRWRLF